MTKKLKFITSSVVGTIGLIFEIIDYVHGFEFLKDHAPWLYDVLSSPITGAVLLILAVSLAAHARFGHGGEREQPSHEAPAISPTKRNDATGNKHVVQDTQQSIIAGRDVYMASQEAKKVAAPTVPLKQKVEQPRIIQRGIAKQICTLPYFDEESRRWEKMEGASWGFVVRNDADSWKGQLSDVVAHIDFKVEEGDSICVNEGWWVEDDADRRSQITSMSIGRSETKHLVLVYFHEEERRTSSGRVKSVTPIVLEKRWDSDSLTHLPGEKSELSNGKWRVTISIRAENYREEWSVGLEVTLPDKFIWSEPERIPSSV